MCDTKKIKIRKCDINILVFFACDVFLAYTSCVWYLKGDYQYSAISVIPACYTNTNVYIKTGHLIEDVTKNKPEIRE